MKPGLDESKILYVTNRKEWRGWLKRHYKSEKDIWLVYYKKHTRKPRISYNDAVEEALCFGWIDSIVRTIDEDKFAQRFSARKAKSRYSQANLERNQALAKQGKVMKEVLATIPNLSDDEFEIPPDILDCAARETYEETGLRVSIGKLIYLRDFHELATDSHHVELFFLADHFHGSLTTEHAQGKGPDEEFIQELRWLTRLELQALTVYPPMLKDELWQDLADGFPTARYLGVETG